MNIAIKVGLLKMCENFSSSSEILSSEELLRAVNCVAQTCVKDPHTPTQKHTHIDTNTCTHKHTHTWMRFLFIFVYLRETAQIYY